MQMVEINSKNVDSITREGKTYLYFTAGSAPLRRPWSRSIRNF